MRAAAAEGLFPVPPFHRELVRGVATYALEFFRAAPPLDTVYVPIGCGSGICGVIAARDALGLATEVVGVVSTEAAGAKLSVEAGRLTETNSARTFADGMAVRVPVQAALDIYGTGAARIVAVGEDEIAEAVRLYFTATHNLAEGAGAAAARRADAGGRADGGPPRRADPVGRQYRHRLVPDDPLRRARRGHETGKIPSNMLFIQNSHVRTGNLKQVSTKEPGP